jgi:hypothetical protein
MFGEDAQRKRLNDGKVSGRARVLVVATTSRRRRNSRCIIGRQPCIAGLIANG